MLRLPFDVSYICPFYFHMKGSVTLNGNLKCAYCSYWFISGRHTLEAKKCLRWDVNVSTANNYKQAITNNKTLFVDLSLSFLVNILQLKYSVQSGSDTVYTKLSTQDIRTKLMYKKRINLDFKYENAAFSNAPFRLWNKSVRVRRPYLKISFVSLCSRVLIIGKNLPFLAGIW